MASKVSPGLGIAEAELTERVADAMKAASRSYVEALVRDLTGLGFGGLTPSSAALLGRIPGQGVQAAVLAQLTGRSKQAVAKLIAELEEGGYVRRTPDPADRRGQLVLLTDRGDGVVAEGARVKARLAEEAIGLLGAETMQRLHRDLDALAELLSRHSGATG